MTSATPSTMLNETGLRHSLDTYTRAYFDAQCSVIAEHSGSILREQRALLAEVNFDRETAGLEPIAAPDHWLDQEDDA